ncbi:ABC transporter permease [Propionicimonas sp.]|uniref:ABC transporter permease n=1 Tax=Propionicimonas sp. TaxID=1955623 RepID=UPI0017D7EFAC|nr:ABC transporter permease [Propionicimonas sp.]MBU3977492.1 ABC transporter permease [Actinomycetota bacterium]MBA3021417.1 ABC transporter permease [Propionicimonas sp.]MBU3986002.1 ABC transporter permease [Actinomycetota bacterium]MBU4008787.1 ABC transporter permease [Actinomycetota bacterium]MBU4066063.1 ABC transporter permease [Actinomycetota bacterium]
MQLGLRIAKRLGVFSVSLLGASLLIFAITQALPGDVAQVLLGTDATPEAVAQLRAQLGLDRPWLVQYLDWIGGILTGDFGVSHLSGDAVVSLLLPRLAVTMWLVGFAMFGSLLLAVPAGMIAALKRRSWQGILVSASAQVGMAIPVFWGGILAVVIFAVWLRWLPANGYVPLTQNPASWAAHLVLPVLTLSAVQAAVLIRYVRSAFVEVLNEDYYRTARSIGWTPMRALFRHGLRNVAISLVTVLGLQVSSVLVGAIVIESVFSLPGLGSLLMTAVAQRDLLVVQGTVMFLVLAVLAISALVDFSYLLIDPRQRTGREA